MPASPRKNDPPETRGPKFVVAWNQLPLGVPVGHVPHCDVMVAPAVATAGTGDRSGGRSTRKRRTHPPEPREEESRSSFPRRASGRGNPQLNWSDGAETLEPVLHSAKRPKTLDSCSYPRPIVVNGCNHFPNFQDVLEEVQRGCSRHHGLDRPVQIYLHMRCEQHPRES
jgi:hypothetical protein